MATTFRYSAHDGKGIVTGEIPAADRAEALVLLGKRRLQPLKLEAAGSASGSVSHKEKTRHHSKPGKDENADQKGAVRLKLSQLVLFTEELGEMLGAGIQLEPALAAMERRRELSGVKAVATSLRSKLQDGMSLSRALPATSPSFGNLYCALAAAGEASGAMPAILKRQAQYLRSLQELRAKVLFALIYPAFLVTAAVSVTLLFVVYLIPKLTELLDSTGGSLPAGAKLIVDFSDFVKATWWMGALAVGAGWLMVKAWLSRPESQVPWSRMLLRIPVFGRVLKARFYVQFLETMANLSGGGLPMIQALQLTRQATDNAYLRGRMNGVIDSVAEGTALSRAMDRSDIFPPLLLDMVSVGEQTGNLSDALNRTAERFDRELAQSVEKLSSMIQPAIVCLMAGLVGIMAWLMITTIFQTISGISG